MADKGTDTHPQTAGVIKEEIQSIPSENKQEAQTATAEQEYSEVDSTSPPASTEKENNNYQDKDTHSFNVQGSSSAEDVSVPSTEGSCDISEELSVLNAQENNTSPEEQDNGDKNGETLHESAVTTNKHSDEGPLSDKDGSGDKETTEMACSSLMGDQTDGLSSVENEESPEMEDTGEAMSKDDEEEELEKDETPEKQKDSNNSTTTTLRKQVIEEVGPITQEETKPIVPEVAKNLEGHRRYWIPVVIVILVAILVQQLLLHESPPQKKDVRQIDVFLREMTKVKTQFPNQRVELWNRSKIHLQRHFQIAHPTEPVSLILTAGLKAERTLRCLAKGLASAFSTALNASVLHIDGVSKASQDSDQVKLDIDSQLQGAFEGDKPVAVIHRFEELPPGSTLIFYRYCDHENAAYKKTFLIFTILLGEEEIPAKVRLSAVEEMVDDHLQKKFLSHGHPTAFDKMDIDKYGGLWSRISHLILPVAAEEGIEQKGC
ncbi:torsin-1A-interacting protein 2-like isoform X3 [Sphaeramia orbicularis]|uniref:torsin-1A-interacting protein 2-like isoform X3 n=1 Tax=Sphaeramia orbicularis TaxID=375764 RepID=UPI00117FBCA1|nr:torsin-1A-interacting protein 2-like isoform X3 [Sphaeramia orbicularis]